MDLYDFVSISMTAIKRRKLLGVLSIWVLRLTRDIGNRCPHIVIRSPYIFKTKLCNHILLLYLNSGFQNLIPRESACVLDVSSLTSFSLKLRHRVHFCER